MTLEELLGSKRISKVMYDDYVLFAVSDLGREWLNRQTHETFMDEPSPNNCKGVAFAYMDGRRSLLRNIKSIVETINHLIKETSNDSNTQPQ